MGSDGDAGEGRDKGKDRSYEDLIKEIDRLKQEVLRLTRSLEDQDLLGMDIEEFEKRQKELQVQMDEFLKRHDKFKKEFLEYSRERDRLEQWERDLKDREDRIKRSQGSKTRGLFRK